MAQLRASCSKTLGLGIHKTRIRPSLALWGKSSCLKSYVVLRQSPLQANASIYRPSLSTNSQILREQHTAIATDQRVQSQDPLSHTSKRRSDQGRVVTEQAVGYWLIGSAVLVFGIVVFGGLTRLTESGLSITEWKPITGVMPPRSATEWQDEFSKYKDSPECRVLNPGITLSEFKFIYLMEWTHRVWGRAIGLVFVLPASYFVIRRMMSTRVALRITGVATLIGFQGFIGWWMVKSGLKDELFKDPGSTPRVSQYRLAVHLGTAFAVYLSMLWTGLEILRENKWLRGNNLKTQAIEINSASILRPFKRSLLGLGLLTFLTAMSGAFVAGLDAGLIYNEFPYMGNSIVPPREELMDDFYARLADKSDRWWRNIFENPTTVQFDHRVLATATFLAATGLYYWSRRFSLTKSSRKAATAMLCFVWLQVALGISTLVYLVPTPLAAAHQANSLAVLSSVLLLGSTLTRPRTAFLKFLKTAQSHQSSVARNQSAAIRNIHSSCSSGRFL